MKATQLTQLILAAYSFLGELGSVMRASGIPAKKEGRVSSSKTAVNIGATSWDISRDAQAQLMLRHFGKDVTPSTVESMAQTIANHAEKAKAGYALEKAFSVKVNDLHKAFTDAESVPVNVAPLSPVENVAPRKAANARKASENKVSVSK